MKQVLIKKGRASIEEVPAPNVSPNTILVKVHYSCISSGTEVSGLSSSGESLLKKAINQPQKITKVFDHVKKQGIAKTIDKVKDKVDQPTATGYSAAGEVIEVGENIKNMQVGDKVACAGAGIANHAEYIEVPKNLFVKIPSNVNLDQASTVALGSIAMQGVRRADVRLGEYVAVIGLGILGQITVQLLKANGCHVIGTDLSDRRIKKALSLGLDEGVNAQDEELIKKVILFSNGYGVDSVIITAATDSHKPLSQAFQICRKKGKVVLVGVVGMEINREDMYKKETDFLISTSYGPGRYDEKYEKKSIDYPYAYVRWTESRNMEEYLNLIAEKKIQIKPLIEKTYKIEDVSKAYEEIQSSKEKPIISLLEYASHKKNKLSKKIEIKAKSIKKEGQINLALIGAGEFAKSVHLPNIKKLALSQSDGKH